MHDVSNAINILDPSYGIDKKICYGSGIALNNNNDTAEKCTGGSSFHTQVNAAGETNTSGNAAGLWLVTSTKNDSTKFASDTDKLSAIPNTSSKITKDIRGLNRDQKGVVSSAFAKALLTCQPTPQRCHDSA